MLPFPPLLVVCNALGPFHGRDHEQTFKIQMSRGSCGVLSLTPFQKRKKSSSTAINKAVTIWAKSASPNNRGFLPPTNQSVELESRASKEATPEFTWNLINCRRRNGSKAARRRQQSRASANKYSCLSIPYHSDIGFIRILFRINIIMAFANITFVLFVLDFSLRVLSSIGSAAEWALGTRLLS